jgi:hypothetical protein
LFYYQAKSTATWYAVHQKHFVSFRMDDYAFHPSVAKEPEVSDVVAGDYHDGLWEYAIGKAIYRMPFDGLEHDADLAGKDKTEQIATTTFVPSAMAYDYIHEVLYANYEQNLYRINYDTKAAEYVGTFVRSDKNEPINVVGMAFDVTGTLFVLGSHSDYGRLFRVTEMNEEEGYVAATPADGVDGNIGMYVSGHQPIAFDYKSGELLWAEQYYMRMIHPATCQVHICGDYGMSNGFQLAFASLHCMNAKPSKPDPDPHPEPEPDPKPEEGIETLDIGHWTLDNCKIIREGRLYIMYKGQLYNVQGQRVK